MWAFTLSDHDSESESTVPAGVDPDPKHHTDLQVEQSHKKLNNAITGMFPKLLPSRKTIQLLKKRKFIFLNGSFSLSDHDSESEPTAPAGVRSGSKTPYRFTSWKSHKKLNNAV
jgi:hypothetical protein